MLENVSLMFHSTPLLLTNVANKVAKIFSCVFFIYFCSKLKSPQLYLLRLLTSFFQVSFFWNLAHHDPNIGAITPETNSVNTETLKGTFPVVNTAF